MDLNFENWGRVSYSKSLERQLEKVAEVEACRKIEGGGETIIFCTHDPVVTLGRGTQEQDVFGWNGEVCETGRGGRATYHGPSQLVIYPILDLTKKRSCFKSKDIMEYLYWLEDMVVSSLEDLGCSGLTPSRLMDEREGAAVSKNKRSKSAKQLEGSPQRSSAIGSIEGQKDLSLTGVWKGKYKIASIGVAIKKWIAYHGIAINTKEDARAFTGIRPCGYAPEIMSSLEHIYDKPFEYEELCSSFSESIRQNFS